FISAHHLVIDGVSWRILLDDLWNAYGQISQNKKVALPLKTNSYKEWVEKLNDYANSEKVEAMLNYWKDNLPSDFRKLPLDYDKNNENLEESSEVVMTSLSKEDTTLLQHKIQNTHIGLLSINEILIAALFKTITQWTNSSSLYIDMESHGRDIQFSDQIDVSRTIGWFTSIYPLYIKTESVDGNCSEAGNIISMIKEKLNGIPEKGISYSLLKYLNKNDSLSENIRRYPSPEMSYNYLGQFNQRVSPSGYEILSSAVKKERGLKNKRLYILDFSSSIIDQRLNLYWTYSKNLHSKKTISDLADLYMSNLQAILKYILSSNINDVLSSNKKDFGLDEKQIENLLDELDEG
ncbi:MAG: condensation domain-containing protein, partial [Clostridiales bacterium]